MSASDPTAQVVSSYGWAAWESPTPVPPTPLSAIPIVPSFDASDADIAIVAVHANPEFPYNRPPTALFKVDKTKLSQASPSFNRLCQTACTPISSETMPRILLEEPSDIIKIMLDVIFDRSNQMDLLRRIPWDRLSLLWQAAHKFQLPLLKRFAEEMLITRTDKADISSVVGTLSKAAVMGPDGRDVTQALLARAAKEPISRAGKESVVGLPPPIFMEICRQRDAILVERFKILLQAFKAAGYPTKFQTSDPSIERVSQLLMVDTSEYRYENKASAGEAGQGTNLKTTASKWGDKGGWGSSNNTWADSPWDGPAWHSDHVADEWPSTQSY